MEPGQHRGLSTNVVLERVSESELRVSVTGLGKVSLGHIFIDPFCCSKADTSKEASFSLIGFLVFIVSMKRLSFSKGEKSPASTHHFICNFIHYFHDITEVQVLKDILCRVTKKKKKKSTNQNSPCQTVLPSKHALPEVSLHLKSSDLSVVGPDSRLYRVGVLVT